jgi:hypothetical protein
LLYGEILPGGVDKLFDSAHLNVSTATRLVDLGCGLGKLVLQAFLQYPGLLEVYGVELCQSRFTEACNKFALLAKENPHFLTWSYLTSNTGVEEGTLVLLSGTANNLVRRTLILRKADLFNCGSLLETADIILCETDVPVYRRSELVRLLTTLQKGSRFLLYHPLSILPDVVVHSDEATIYTHTSQHANANANANTNTHTNRNKSLIHTNTRINTSINTSTNTITVQTHSNSNSSSNSNLHDEDGWLQSKRQKHVYEFTRILKQEESFISTSWSRNKGHAFDMWICG